MSFISFVIGTAVGTLFSSQIKAGTLASVKFCKDKFAGWKEKNAAKVAEQVDEVDKEFGDTKVPPKPSKSKTKKSNGDDEANKGEATDKDSDNTK